MEFLILVNDQSRELPTEFTSLANWRDLDLQAMISSSFHTAGGADKPC